MRWDQDIPRGRSWESARFPCVTPRLLMKSDRKAGLPPEPGEAAGLLHNQGLEMQLPPTELEGSLPSARARKFGFPCPHLSEPQLGNLSSLPQKSPGCGSPSGPALASLFYHANSARRPRSPQSTPQTIKGSATSTSPARRRNTSPEPQISPLPSNSFLWRSAFPGLVNPEAYPELGSCSLLP